MFRLVVLALSALVLASPLVAHDHGKGMKGAPPELRAQIRTWFEQSVAPTLKGWQKTYDATLSADDLATVQRLRAQAAQLRQQPKPDRREAMHALMEELKPVMQRSRETLRALFDANEETIEGWRSRVKDMMAQHMTDHPAGKGKHRGKHHGIPMMGHGKRAAVFFVLWDGSTPPMDGAMMQTPAWLDDTAPRLSDGPATIDIYDMNGTLVRSLKGTIANGDVQERIDLNGLAKGQYMASIKAADGTRRTIIVQR